ncbi:MAG: glucosidase, partial [Verrucomicrobiae bacterium]|nr:glucosidase [Verrucomicrobiae bacterium]
PSRDRLRRMLGYLGNEHEFLSPFGIRSLSRHYEANPYRIQLNGEEYRVDYAPGESDTELFGGNSNWRGPVWFPMNYLLIEALERYHHFYGPEFTLEYPAGSGRQQTLAAVAGDLERRLISLFLPDPQGRRPCHGANGRFATDPHWRDLILFHEYFHAETGRGCGASHQTGWTALVLRFLQDRTPAFCI